MHLQYLDSLSPNKPYVLMSYKKWHVTWSVAGMKKHQPVCAVGTRYTSRHPKDTKIETKKSYFVNCP
jgi:hypothetical protein